MEAEIFSFSQRGERMPASPIRKLHGMAEAAKKRGIKVYHLNIGQPDIVTPEPIIKEFTCFEEKILEYSPSTGIPSLREAIAGYFSRHRISVHPDDIIVTTGGSEALLFSLAAICDPGDEIIIPEPFYANYLGFATMLSIKIVPLPTEITNGFHLPVRQTIEKLVTPRTRAILFSSPGNPTGTVFLRKELEGLADVVSRTGIYLIADEVYREFVYDLDTDYVSVLELAEISDHVIVTDSISKRFSSCGARIGCIISRNQAFLHVVEKFAQARLSPPTVGQIAAEAGYRMDPSYFDPIRNEYKKRRDTVAQGLSVIPGTSFRVPEGAFYFMAKLPLDDADNFCRFLLTDFTQDAKTVMLAPGAGFYFTPGSGADEVRIAYVLKSEKLADAMDILRRGIEAYQALMV